MSTRYWFSTLIEKVHVLDLHEQITAEGFAIESVASRLSLSGEIGVDFINTPSQNDLDAVQLIIDSHTGINVDEIKKEESVNKLKNRSSVVLSLETSKARINDLSKNGSNPDIKLLSKELEDIITTIVDLVNVSR